MNNSFYSQFLRLKAEKQEINSTAGDVNNFFQPSDSIYSGRKAPRTGRAVSGSGELLDTTCSEVIEEHVANVLGLYFNTEISWFKLELPTADITDDDQKVLTARQNRLYRLIARSNYYAVNPQHEWDVLIQGHGLMAIEKDEDEFARCYTKQPIDLYFVQSEDHKVIETYWESTFTESAFIFKYGNNGKTKLQEMRKKGAIKNKPEGSFLASSPISLISCVVPNTPAYSDYIESQGIDIEDRDKDYLYIVQLVDGSYSGSGIWKKFKEILGKKSEAVFLEVKGVSKNRFCPARNKPSRDHPYGDGEGKKLLPKARIMNKLTRDSLNSSEDMSSPARVMDADLYNQLGSKKELRGGKLLVKSNNLAPSSQKPIETVDTRGDLGGTIALMEHQEKKITAKLSVGSTYKTARQSIQEIQQRLRDQDKRLGPLRSHYLKEGVSQHLRRFYDIAKEQGYFDSPEYTFNDAELEKMTPKFNFDTLLLSSHRLTKALAINQFLAQAQGIFAIKPQSTFRIDEQKAIKLIGEGNGVSEVLLSDSRFKEIKESVERQAQNEQAIQQQNAAASGIVSGSQALGNITDAIKKMQSG